jgi:hypothetical protein
MGKANEGSNPTNDEDEGTVDCSCCSACASSVCTITTLKWVVAVAVCVNLLVFTVLSLPISGKGNVRPASVKHPQGKLHIILFVPLEFLFIFEVNPWGKWISCFFKFKLMT